MVKKSKKINRMVITGGGTGGHVFPALRIAKAFQRTGTDVLYIGSKNGMENKLSKDVDVNFKSISTGKLRRYFDWKNFSDPFLIILGFFQSYIILRKFNPQVVFSKGGYVSVPVVVAAWLLRIPIILHESDMSPGLANRILIKFAKKICLSFKESSKYIKSNNYVVTGNPIREELFLGDIKKAKIITGFDDKLPVVFVCGGSLGSSSLNKLVLESLDKILKFSQVILQCGKGKQIEISKKIKNRNRFFQVEFVGVKALANFYKFADIIVSRAGAGQITELAFLGKPSILIPLGLEMSRGDQILNSKILEKTKSAIVLKNEKVTSNKFCKILEDLLNNKKRQDKLSKSIQRYYDADSVKKIVKEIKEVV